MAVPEPPEEVTRALDEYRAAQAADPDYSPAYQDEYQRLWHKAAQERDTLRRLCRPVVERYGTHWRKDDAYYAAAEALGIKEPPDVRPPFSRIVGDMETHLAYEGFIRVALPHVATGRVCLVDADAAWQGEKMKVTLCGRRALARVDQTADLLCSACERVAGALR